MDAPGVHLVRPWTSPAANNRDSRSALSKSVAGIMLVIITTTQLTRRVVGATYAYTPELAAKYWPAIGPFIEAAVGDAAPWSTYSERALFAAATPLTLWAWQTAGLPLDRSTIFSLATIDRFVGVGLVTYSTAASRNTLRSRLLRMSELLVTQTSNPRSLRPLGASASTAPYSKAEVSALKSWARSQRTGDRLRSAECLLALGLGAGLSGKEIIATRIDDIEVDDMGVVVRVRGARPRAVPVIRQWERALVEQAGASNAEGWAFRKGQAGDNPNLISDFVSRSRGKIDLQARRMRTTWIVGHLDAHTPPFMLLRAAGMQSLEALNRFAHHLTPQPFEREREALRGTDA